MEQAASIDSWEPWLNISREVVEQTNINPRYPNGIVVAVMMLIGLLGNSLVLYVYHRKMEHTVFTTFIIFLASLDLTTTLTSMPLDVVIKWLQMDKTQTMEVICKMAHFEVYTSSLASGSILLLIAATRYSKVCKPTQPSWTVHQARVSCLLIVMVATALCTVSLVINGMEKIKISTGVERFYPENLTQNSNLQTNPTLPHHTGILHVSNTAAGDVMNSDSLHVSNTAAGDVMNSELSPHDFHHNDSSYLTRTKVVEVYICRASEQQKGTPLYYALYGLLMMAYITICLSLLILHCRISFTLLQFKRKNFRRGSVWSDQDQHNLNHITSGMFRIFVAITVIFVLSYLPHLACIAVQRLAFTPGEAMPRTTRIFLDLAYNFPYINVIANPFIYGFMSRRFRSYCFYLLCSCCRRRCRRY